MNSHRKKQIRLRQMRKENKKRIEANKKKGIY